MTVTVVLVQIVREVRRVPYHHVLVAETLSIVEAVNIGRSSRLGGAGLARGGRYSVVDLPLFEPQYPHVRPREGVRDAVVWTWNQVVGITCLCVPDLPPSTEVWPSATRWPRSGECASCPGKNGWGVELAHHVVLRGTYVEVQPPVDVVVDVADARISYSREPEARSSGAAGASSSSSSLLLGRQTRGRVRVRDSPTFSVCVVLLVLARVLRWVFDGARVVPLTILGALPLLALIHRTS
jgi:hypothetical protein